MELFYIYGIVFCILIITGGLMMDAEERTYVQIKRCSMPASWYAPYVKGRVKVTKYDKLYYRTVKDVAGPNVKGFILISDTK